MKALILTLLLSFSAWSQDYSEAEVLEIRDELVTSLKEQRAGKKLGFLQRRRFRKKLNNFTKFMKERCFVPRDDRPGETPFGNRVKRTCLNLKTLSCMDGITTDRGPNAGICFNDDYMRAVKKVPNEELPLPYQEKIKVGENEEAYRYLVVENFSHGTDKTSGKQKYHVAVIDLLELDESAKVWGQLERFPPKWLAAHAQMRYDLKNGAMLFDSLSDFKTGKGPTEIVSSIITSIEAMKPHGKPYELIGGTREKFLAVFRLKSLDDVIDKAKAVTKYTVDIEELPLKFQDNINKALLLSDYVNKGTKIGYGVRYHTFVFNCTNGLFIQAERILKRIGKKLRGGWKTFLPVFVPRILKESGILGGEPRLLDLTQKNSRKPLVDRKKIDTSDIKFKPHPSCNALTMNMDKGTTAFQQFLDGLKDL